MKLTILAILLLLSRSLARPSNAAPKHATGTGDIREVQKAIRKIQESMKLLQQDMEEIKGLLNSRQVPPPAPAVPETVRVGDDPFLGSPTSRVVLINYSDYQCPFCVRFAVETLPQIMREYVATGRIRYVFHDHPLLSLHPLALKAAQSVRCAGDQGRFWEMHDLLYKDQGSLSLVKFKSHAMQLGLNIDQFSRCLDNGKFDMSIQKASDEAMSAGFQATPSFVVGLINPLNPKDPNVKVIQTLVGAQPFSQFKVVLDAALLKNNH